ncbi:HYR domain-containing protein, partial [Mariprofundus sp. EBB-1]|uniref:HYR domain-containing protein n=1 Tax=Mariprofundus sp. EBB-1 TaxID=2650971 RepID=UPI000EF19081
MGNYVKLLLAGLFMFAATVVQAVPVSVQTNGFTQEWYTNSLASGGYSPYYNGDKIIDLTPGRYYFGIVHPGAGGQGHLIEVLADGTINDLANDGALSLSPGVISLNIIDITIDPAGYEGRWQLGHSGWKKPKATVRVVKGQHYGLSLGWPMGTGFTINAAGQLTLDDPIAASVTGTILILNTVPVHFDPVNYLGQYAIHYGTRWISGKNTLMLVPNQNYYFGIAGMDAIYFALDAQGNVNLDFSKGPSGPNPTQYWLDKIADKSVIALASIGSRVDTIRFKNTQASIDLGSYVGLVAVHRILVGNRGHISGKQSLVLVPNLRNGIYLNAWGHFFFRVDALGNLTVENGVSASVNYSTQTGLFSDMVLNNHKVQVDPGAYTGNWDMWEGSGLVVTQTTGPKTITMVDGVDYPIRTSAAPWGTATTSVSKTWFQVTPACQITPSGIIPVGTEIFQVSCVNPNIAPVAHAGGAQTVEQTSPAGALVTLNGSGSSDADGDSLTYAWTGPFGTADGIAPTVQFPAGTNNANLTVNDGTVDSSGNSVIITVQDTTAPVVTAPAAIKVEATGAQTTVAIGTATATDAVGVVSISSDALTSFALGTTTVNWTAADAVGNSGTATQSVTVSDTTAPVLTVPANVSI